MASFSALTLLIRLRSLNAPKPESARKPGLGLDDYTILAVQVKLTGPGTWGKAMLIGTLDVWMEEVEIGLRATTSLV